MPVRHSGRQTQRFNELVYNTYGYVCVYCGTDLDTTNRSVDHIKPFSKHPELEFDLDNARPACITCNRIKSNKTTNVRHSWINNKYLKWSDLK